MRIERIGSYSVTAKIGEGGMGEVYWARAADARAYRFGNPMGRNSMRYLAFFVALLAVPGVVVAQDAANDGYFEMARLNTDFVGTFETFMVEETRSLAQALAGGLIAEDTAVLVTETAAGKLALLTDQMWWHHLAQGEAAGAPWLVSF